MAKIKIKSDWNPHSGFEPRIIHAEPGKVLVGKFLEGGVGSGHYGHLGIKGHRGGSMPGTKTFAILAGGPATGKSTLRNDAQKKYGVPDKDVIDADEIKKEMKIYRDNPNLTQDDEPEPGIPYGPSGPPDMAGLAKYPADQVKQTKAFIKAQTGMTPEEFGEKLNDPSGQFGGGLTHEVSSYLAKQRIEAALKGEKSTVVDAVGKPGLDSNGNPLPGSTLDLALRAVKQGFNVVIRKGDIDVESARARNDQRPRTVSDDILTAGHAKANAAAKEIEAFVNAHPELPIRFTRRNTGSDTEHAVAVAQGYTATGWTAPYPGAIRPPKIKRPKKAA